MRRERERLKAKRLPVEPILDALEAAEQAFEEITGLPPTGDNARKWQTWDRQVRRLPWKPVDGPTVVNPIGSFTLVLGTKPVGKRIVVNGGRIVETVSPKLAEAKAEAKQLVAEARPWELLDARRKADAKVEHAKTSKDFSETFLTFQDAPFANLEDVRAWLLLADHPTRFVCRHPVKRDFRPGVIGARRAFRPGPAYGKADHPAFEDGPSRLVCFDIDNTMVKSDFPLHDPVAVDREALKYLPREVAQARRLVTPTTGYGRPGTSVHGGERADGRVCFRVRVVVILDRPMGYSELALWAPPLAGKEGSDASVFKASQPIYTNRLCRDEITGEPAEDPFAALRWVMHDGAEFCATPAPAALQAVAKDKPSKPKAPRPAGQRVKQGTGRAEYRAQRLDTAGLSIGEIVDLMGDGEGQAGYHDPLIWAALKFAHGVDDLGEDAQQAAHDLLLQALKDTAHRAAPGRSCDPVTGYKDKILAIVEWAFVQVAEQRAGVGEAFDVVQDTFNSPIPTATAEECGAGYVSCYTGFMALPHGRTVNMKGVFFEAFKQHEEGALELIFDPQEFIKAGRKAGDFAGYDYVGQYNKTPKWMAGGDRRALTLAAAGLAEGSQWFLARVSVGVGKTTETVKLFRQVMDGTVYVPKHKNETVRLMWAAPNHALADETAARLPGMKCYRGADYKGDEDGRGSIDGWCSAAMERSVWVRSGGRQETFCHSVCPFGKGPMELRCGYMQQVETLAGATVYGFGDGLGSLHRPLPLVCKKAGWKKRPHLAVCDEPAISKRVGVFSFRTDDWVGPVDLRRQLLDDILPLLKSAEDTKQRPWSKVTAALGKLEGFFQGLQKDFTHNPTNAGVVMTVGRLKPLAGLLKGVKPKTLHAAIVAPSETTLWDDEADPLDQLNVSLGDPFARLWKWNRMIRAAIALLGALRRFDWSGYVEDHSAVGWEFDLEGAENERIRVFKFPIRYGVAQDFENSPVLLLDATGRPEITPYLGPRVSECEFLAAAPHQRVTVHMVASRKTDWADRADLIREWAVAQATGGKKVGVVVQKACAERLTEFYREVGGPPFEVLHFGVHRGTNAMERVDVLGVFGRPLPSASWAFMMSNTLQGRLERCGELSRTFPACWRLSDGETVVEGVRWGLAGDKLANALVRQTAEGEVIQAVGRARGVRRTAANPVHVHLFTDAVVEGLVVDDVLNPVDFDVAVRPWLASVVGLLEAGAVPVTRSAAFWRALAGCSPEAWRQRRRLDFGDGGRTLGEWLDAAEAEAKAAALADKAVELVTVQIGEVTATVALPGKVARSALAAVASVGGAAEGKARRDALRGG